MTQSINQSPLKTNDYPESSGQRLLHQSNWFV